MFFRTSPTVSGWGRNHLGGSGGINRGTLGSSGLYGGFEYCDEESKKQRMCLSKLVHSVLLIFRSAS